MAKTNAEDKKIYSHYKSKGCSPAWADGILGWKYHCGCEALDHAVDSQCSALD